MEAALRLADRLDEWAILEMHRELLSAQPGWHDQAGRYRDQLVWVGAAPSRLVEQRTWGRCRNSSRQR